MKYALSPALALALLMTAAGAARADDDCRGPMAEWRPRDAAMAHVEQMGVRVDRLRVDDGCYEVRGVDQDGNRVEMKLNPSTLVPVKLEVKFRPGADASRYLPGAAPSAPDATPPARSN